MNEKRTLPIKAELADEGRIAALSDAMARKRTLADAPPDIQKLALYFDNLRAKNRRGRAGCPTDRRSIKSVRAAEHTGPEHRLPG